METQTEKILYITTVGPENPDKAAFPFVLANAALAMDVEATIVLQSNAVHFGKVGFADTVPAAGGLPPIKKLLDDFLELGGKMWICGTVHQVARNRGERAGHRHRGHRRGSGQHRRPGRRCALCLLKFATMNMGGPK